MRQKKPIHKKKKPDKTGPYLQASPFSVFIVLRYEAALPHLPPLCFRRAAFLYFTHVRLWAFFSYDNTCEHMLSSSI